jgi:hypothetical protein
MAVPEEPGMVPMYGLAVSGQLPGRIADLVSIHADLSFAEEAFRRVAVEETDMVVRRACWDAGVIAYRRGFTGGKAFLQQRQGRSRISDVAIDALGADHREVHDHLLVVANEHVAHRVSDAEQVIVQIVLSNPTVRRAVEGVAFLHGRYLGPFPERASKAADLAGMLREVVAAELESLRRVLMDTAKKRDLDSLYADATPMGVAAEE